MASPSELQFVEGAKNTLLTILFMSTVWDNRMTVIPLLREILLEIS